MEKRGEVDPASEENSGESVSGKGFALDWIVVGWDVLYYREMSINYAGAVIFSTSRASQFSR